MIFQLMFFYAERKKNDFVNFPLEASFGDFVGIRCYNFERVYTWHKKLGQNMFPSLISNTS